MTALRKLMIRLKTFFFVLFCASGTALVLLQLVLYRSPNGSIWMRSFGFSPDEPAHETFQCVSRPGALGILSSYRAKPPDDSIKTHSQAIARMLMHGLTDDYCYCNKSQLFYRTPELEKQSKNPCWRDWDGKLRCVPYFQIIGFSKSATSDLYRCIIRHPSIAVTERKEAHWFDYLRFVDRTRYLENFTDLFSSSARTIDSDLKTSGSSRFIFGDATPCTAWFSLHWRCFHGNEPWMSEPLYTNADVVHTMYAGSKIIVSVRDPTSRLYSRYLTWRKRVPHHHYKHASPVAFHELSRRAVDLYSRCMETYTARHCAYNGTLYTEALLRLQEGMYSVFLKDWLKVFPKEQILIVRFENYVKDRRKTLEKIWTFLGVDPPPKKLEAKFRKMNVINPGHYEEVGPMLDKTKWLLDNFYKPFQEELAELIRNNSFSLA